MIIPVHDTTTTARGFARRIFVALGCLFSFDSLFVIIPFAWLAARAGSRVRASASAARWLTGAVGALFVVLAARLVTLERT